MQIYADNAATTKMSEAAIEAMTDGMRPPSSTPTHGRSSSPRAAAKRTIRRC